MAGNKLKRYTSLCIKLALTLLALFAAYRAADIGKIWPLIKEFSIPAMVAAAFFFILSKIISAYRLNRYFRSIGLKLTEQYNLRLYWLGMFYNLSLPGGIGGDGYKVYLLNRETGIKRGPLLKAVLYDRFSGVVWLLALALCLLPFTGLRLPYIRWTVLLIPAGIWLFRVITKRFFPSFLPVLFHTSIESILVQTLQLFSMLVLLGGAGVYTNLPAYLFLFLVSSIAAALPFTIGGAGARELSFIYGAKWLQLDGTVAFSVSLIFFSITLLVSLSGIFARPEIKNSVKDVHAAQDRTL